MVKGAWILCLLLMVHNYAKSQELDPRAYAALPKNLNSIAALYGLQRGNVLTDPSLPISNFEITVHSLAGAYLRTFSLANKLARIQIAIPYVFILGKLQIDGRDTSGSRSGFGDANLRFGINLTGSPALGKAEFSQYTQKTIFGMSLVSTIPIGEYHPDKRINIGSNRWAFKPEVGASKRFKNVYAEAYGGIRFFTNNHKYLGSKTLKQKPVFDFQSHITYYFKNKMWLSFNTTWFNGGQTIVDSVKQGELLDNWRVGGTWSFPVARGQSLKLQFHVGAFTTSAYHYDAVSVGYLHLF